MRCLGKKPARAGAIRFRLAAYTDAAALPPVPLMFGHETLLHESEWQILGNDQYGDCVFAGAAHETMMLAREAKKTVPFNTAAVLSDYSAVTGFKISDPNSDNGTDVQEAAKYRQTTGILDSNGDRHKIAAYLALDPGNVTHIYQAMYLFGAVGIGIQIPSSAMDQNDKGQVWSPVKGSSNEGGHYVPGVGRNSKGNIVVVTWGALQAMTPAFLAEYCDEAVAYVSEECLVEQKSPEGFDYATLLRDLAALRA